MSNNMNNQRKISYTALGMVIGMVFGGILGLLADNMVIFAGGLVLGLAVGAALDNRFK